MTKLKDLVSKYGDREIDEVELEKLLKPEKIKTIYDLGIGDLYCFIRDIGRVDVARWDNDFIDEYRFAIGNVFLTVEEAEFERERRKVEAELKRYASMCENKVDWNNHNQAKHYLLYYAKKLDIVYRYEIISNEIHFTDKSILEQAIQEIGKERIIKYYFGVEGETNGK